MDIIFFLFEKRLTSWVLLFVFKGNALNSFENDSEKVFPEHGHFPK